MAEEMTEAEIDQLLVRAAKLEIVFYTGTDTEEMHRAIQRDDLQGRLLLFHVVRALRQVREEREGRERYWDGVRRLMLEAGAEPGDAEHLARSLIDQRDAARWQVRRLRESIEDLRFRGFTVDLLPGSMTTGDPPTIEYRGQKAGFIPTTVQRLLLAWKAEITAALAPSEKEAK